MRCAIYSRVSTDEQTTENQLMVLRDIAERKGMTVVAEFNDEGISGAKGRDKRTGFDNIIKVQSKRTSTPSFCGALIDLDGVSKT